KRTFNTWRGGNHRLHPGDGDDTTDLETTPQILAAGQRPERHGVEGSFKATSRQLQGDFKATSICSAGDCGSFSLQKGQRGRRNKAGAVGQRLGMWVLGFTGLKKMRKEEICRG
ncbi:hypothetical protein PIB30_098332, partial [Stylosanthes scabra]|nr:hypothetical protein [Stylosanthes scabra]